MNVRNVLLNRVIEQEAYVEQPQGFGGIPERDSCVQMEEDLV